MFEVFFKDLKPEVQKELLKWCEIEDEYVLNWDVFPIAEIEKPEKGWDYEDDEDDEDDDN